MDRQFAPCFLILWMGAHAVNAELYLQTTFGKLLCSEMYHKTGIRKLVRYDIQHLSCNLMETTPGPLTECQSRSLSFKRVTMCVPVTLDDESCDGFTKALLVNVCQQTTVNPICNKTESPQLQAGSPHSGLNTIQTAKQTTVTDRAVTFRPKSLRTEEPKETTPSVAVSIGMVCTDGSTCNVPRSVCFKGHCLCEPGLAFEDGICVMHCKKYDTTFTLYKGIAIKHHNDKRDSVKGIEECIRMCVEETAFLCLSFEFKQSYITECRISKTGYLDALNGERQTDKSYITFGTRDCVN